MPLDPDTRDYLRLGIDALSSLGAALHHIALQMERANDIAERRINGEETNLGVLSESTQGIATALEHGLSGLTDVVTAAVGNIRIGLNDADGDYLDIPQHTEPDGEWQRESDKTFRHMLTELDGPGPLPEGEHI